MHHVSQVDITHLFCIKESRARNGEPKERNLAFSSFEVKKHFKDDDPDYGIFSTIIEWC